MALTLATVDAAIEQLITGAQSVTVDGQTYTQVSLAALRLLRKDLQNEGGSRYGFGMQILKGPTH